MEYLLHVLILINIYIVIGLSLNLIAGYLGILSIAHAGFYGIGAYVAALMSVHLGWPFLANLPFAILAASLVAILISLPSLRIHQDFLVLATFGFQVILFSIFNNWIPVTRGPLGISNIPAIHIAGMTLDSNLEYFLFSALCAGGVYFLAWKLVNSPLGRVLKAVREDEVFAQSLGKDVTKYKVVVFVLGCGLAAFAGALYAHYFRYIDPTSFTVTESILMVSIVIVGGSGRLAGSVLGAVLLVSLPEVLRSLGMPTAIAANTRQIIYGLMLVVFMAFRPRGLIGENDFK